ncbi:unnamed protein product [Acanthoscelides obtectus]|uniref:Uncharacterized protein n=1 Tax=Acanthoscelides obtectus TaxID=200917 RepID=A0A9P0NWS4_ACAOB|nr:unnamed protein product [Acanthoscelides obtectus]CAK1642806.1 hypothetical protein AOBTE_LOCUS13219 [Acanthoscelides obtectus]
MSSSSYHNSENEGAGPSKKKKINIIKYLRKAGPKRSNLKSGSNREKMNTLVCAVYAVKIFLLKLLAD